MANFVTAAVCLSIETLFWLLQQLKQRHRLLLQLADTLEWVKMAIVK
jgi:hypothetical protein